MERNIWEEGGASKFVHANFFTLSIPPPPPPPVDNRKLRTELEVEAVEVLPPEFVEVGLQAQLGVGPGATMEEVKAAYKKMVLRLHPDKTRTTRRKQQSCSSG